MVWTKILKLVQTFIPQLAGILLKFLLVIHLCVHIQIWMWTQHSSECVLSEDNLHESVLSFHRVGPGLTLRL